MGEIKKLIQLLESVEDKNVEIDQLIKLHASYSKTEHKPDTQRYYREHNNFFNKWFHDHNILWTNDITREVIQQFKEHELNRDIKKSTINIRLRAMKATLNWAFKNEYINTSVHEYLTLLKLEKSPKPYLPKEDYEKIIEKLIIDIKSTDPYIKRNALGVLILCDGGIRISELLKIKLSNIDFETNVILLEDTKSHNDRYMNFSESVKPFIYDYCLNSGRLDYSKNDPKNYMFYNKKTNNRLGSYSIRNYLNSLKEQFNYDRLYPHLFRHTFATLALENGATLYSTQKLLGHEDIKSTQIYAHASKKYMKKEHTKYAPMNHIKTK